MTAPNALKLVNAAMDVRARVPAEWDAFTAAMGEYAAQVLALTMSADPTLVLRAQGMAIQAGEIAKILREAPQIYAAAEAGKQRAQQNHANRKPVFGEWPP